jgi:cytoskeletal protein RodZ
VESLGEKLQTAREAKGISFDQAGRDTNIAIRYLEALEKENFSGFPGEAYITGFIRNYGTYLDLNVQDLLSLYRAIRIYEQPVPVEQLLKTPSPLPKIAVTAAIVVVVLVLVGGGVLALIKRPKKPKAETPVSRALAEHIMNGTSFERRFYKGDSILVPLGADQYKLDLMNLGEAVTLRTPGGSIVLDLSQEANIDLNNDGAADLVVTAADFAKNNADMGVLLRFDMSILPAAAAVPAEIPPVESAAGLSAATVIFSSPSAYPFTLQSSFQGYCMFRWAILFERDRRDRNEQYFQRSDELNIQAQNGIRIWTSNAQAAKFQVIGGGRTVPLELGGAGEVVVADIRWVRDDDNRYRLVLARLETGNS